MKLDYIIVGVFGFPKRQIFIIDDIIDAIGGMGQAGINYAAQNATNQANLQIARETNEANKKLYEQQYADQVAMWEMNNAYNNPSAQMSRLRSAGLNPALNMGTNPTGSAQMASAPTPHPAVTGAPMQAPVFNFSDVFNQLSAALLNRSASQGQEIDNQWKDAKNHQDLLESLSRTQKNIEETKNNPVMRSYYSALKDYQLKELAVFDTNFDLRKQSMSLQNKLLESQNELVQEQSMNVHIDNQVKNIQKQLLAMQARVEPARLQAVLADLWSQAAMQHSAAGMYDKQALKAKCEARGVYLNNKQFEAIAPYLRTVAENGAKSSEYEYKQRKLDYSNPFRYIMSGAGSDMLGGAALLKLFK